MQLLNLMARVMGTVHRIMTVAMKQRKVGCSCWIPGSYTPCTELKHLILNGFFQRCRIGRALVESL